MKVTPVNRNFGKYAPGDEFELKDKAAKIFIKVGKLREVVPAMGYQTRMMAAAPAAVVEPDAEKAPYGYKADGTPRLRPAYNVRKVED